MEEKLKIKISIADRVYPLTVEPSLEEGLRSASKKIDSMIKQYEENYAVRDKQDVLAMCALQFASAQENKKIQSTEEYEDAILRLQNINERIDFVLNKNI
nr:cell division protein ZapA [uncultured Flavobacterium sp.]